jgi:hypothetical protein
MKEQALNGNVPCLFTNSTLIKFLDLSGNFLSFCVMRKILAILFLTFPLNALAQLATISGRVLDAETKEVIEGANVFLGSTSLGASSEKSGKFIIANVPLGSYDVLISVIGYETLTTRIKVALKNPTYTIELLKKVVELEEVSIIADTAGWYGNYVSFTERFLGRTRLARKSKILNPREITFYHDPKDGFYGHAKNPLIIENKSLGYTVTYHLQKFELIYETGVQIVLGIPLFQNIHGNKELPRRIRNARAEAYSGSLMHFLRALKQKRLEEEGFTVYEVFKVKNRKRPAQEYIDKKLEHWRNVRGDSLSYYSRLNRLPVEVDSLGFRFKTGEELFQADGNPATLKFTGMLRVIYTNEKEDPAFIKFGDRGPGTPTVYRALSSEWNHGVREWIL